MKKIIEKIQYFDCRFEIGRWNFNIGFAPGLGFIIQPAVFDKSHPSDSAFKKKYIDYYYPMIAISFFFITIHINF